VAAVGGERRARAVGVDGQTFGAPAGRQDGELAAAAHQRRGPQSSEAQGRVEISPKHDGAVLSSIPTRLVIQETEHALLDARVKDDAAGLEDARAHDLSSHREHGARLCGRSRSAERADGARVFDRAVRASDELKPVE
jgi:hypothetical protein